jgi:hypothetical protein
VRGSEERLSSSVDILQQLATFLRSLTPEEAEDLAQGRTRLTLASRPPKRAASRELPSEQVPEVIRELSRLSTREEGAAYLREVVPTRTNLAQVAVAMDIPVPKADTVSKLRERIVEAAIGYRLRSDAIRGTNR